MNLRYVGIGHFNIVTIIVALTLELDGHKIVVIEENITFREFLAPGYLNWRQCESFVAYMVQGNKAPTLPRFPHLAQGLGETVSWVGHT